MEPSALVRSVVDRSAVSVQSLHDEPDDRTWWWTRTPAERLSAIEAMRRVVYGRAALTGRLQRVSLEDLETNKRAGGRNTGLTDLDQLP